MSSLSTREARLLATWERERRVVVTIDDIARVVGAREVAQDVARRLAGKSALQRIGSGRYLVRPLRQQTAPTQPSTALAAGALLNGTPYYLGGLWAVSFHGLTEQSYVNVIDAFTSTELRSRPLGVGRVRFHRLPAKAIKYGVTRSVIEGLQVNVSDLERTLLDALDRPRVFDGMGSALQRVTRFLERADVSRVIDYAVRGSRMSTCQRLGVLLERNHVSKSRLAPLRRKVRATESLTAMLPGHSRAGPVNTDWLIVENDG
ncbi:MAG: type IV toxin-antitoxin system AbiEi family antitoxin [Myxococcaceae bacterium]